MMYRAPLVTALLAALICAVASGCGINDPKEYYCSLAKPDCPDGYECNGELCVKEGTIQPDQGKPAPDLGVDGPAPDPDGPSPDVAQPDVAQPDVMPDVAPDVPQPDVQTDAIGDGQDDGAGDGPGEDAAGDAQGDASGDAEGDATGDAVGDGIIVVCAPAETEDCYSGSMSTLNQGTCHGGTRTCNDNGTWGPCLDEVLPVIPELCDGLDDDCDGTPDNDCISCTEGETRDCGTSVGLCQTGTQYCTAGKWGSCNGAVGPEPEECDNSDHDCDGNDFNGMKCELGDVGGKCETSCGSKGTEVCKADGTKCVWYCDPPSETCNGLDDDCDGTPDETFDCVQWTKGECPYEGKCGEETGKGECSDTCTWKVCEPPSVYCKPGDCQSGCDASGMKSHKDCEDDCRWGDCLLGTGCL